MTYNIFWGLWNRSMGDVCSYTHKRFSGEQIFLTPKLSLDKLRLKQSILDELWQYQGGNIPVRIGVITVHILWRLVVKVCRFLPHLNKLIITAIRNHKRTVFEEMTSWRALTTHLGMKTTFQTNIYRANNFGLPS